MVEYALLVALMSISCIASIGLFAVNVKMAQEYKNPQQSLSLYSSSSHFLCSSSNEQKENPGQKQKDPFLGQKFCLYRGCIHGWSSLENSVGV